MQCCRRDLCRRRRVSAVFHHPFLYTSRTFILQRPSNLATHFPPRAPLVGADINTHTRACVRTHCARSSCICILCFTQKHILLAHTNFFVVVAGTHKRTAPHTHTHVHTTTRTPTHTYAHPYTPTKFMHSARRTRQSFPGMELCLCVF